MKMLTNVNTVQQYSKDQPSLIRYPKYKYSQLVGYEYILKGNGI